MVYCLFCEYALVITIHSKSYSYIQAGHRVCPSMSAYERVFLAGDAVHTHTAKAGKGMNLSMQDSYNLGWKLASFLRGVASPEILKTYHLERMQTSKRLVAFDKKLYFEIASREQDLQGLRNVLRDENTLESGMAVVYSPSILTISPPKGSRFGTDNASVRENGTQHLSFAHRLVVGGRVPSAPLTRHCDVRPVELQTLLPATGQWHLLVFGGNISNPEQMLRVQTMASQITTRSTCLSRFTNPRPGQHVVGTIKTYLIHSAPRLSIEQQQLPELFLPFHEDYGYDYERVYADLDRTNSLSTYGKLGISPDGCMVLVRPDQHISFIGSLQDAPLLENFMAGITKIA